MSMIPQIYDLEIDGERDVTQSDVRVLGVAMAAFGKMRQVSRAASERLRDEKDPLLRWQIAEKAIGDIYYESCRAVTFAGIPPDIEAARAKADTKEAA